MIKSDGTLISIVMPVYNGASYIGCAIESVLDQTYKNWELVIVDDASTDNTTEVVFEYNDDRIKLFSLEKNSGAAFTPRNRAIELSKGKWIVNLDADDALEKEYLFKMLQRVNETDADVCGSQMTYFEDTLQKEIREPIPRNDFDFMQIVDGRTAFNYTVPSYQIGLNGAMVKREIWNKTFNEFEIPEQIGVHEDENLFRVMLMQSSKVVFVQAKYIYRTNSSSITKIFNERIFEIVKSNQELLKYTESHFGTASYEYKKVLEYDFNAMYGNLRFFVENMHSLTGERKYSYLNKFKEWHYLIKNNTVWNKVKFKKKRYGNHCEILIVLICLRKLRVKEFFFCIKYAIKLKINKFKNSDWYCWNINRKKRENNIKNQLINFYKNKDFDKKIDKKNCVINIYEGSITAGGFADRLRGIISTYAVCKDKGLDYKLYFKNPFPLEAYLVPNEYDWTIKYDEINYDIDSNNIIVLDTTADTKYQSIKQKNYMNAKIKSKNKQYHVYSNAFFSYDLEYSKLFVELFKPSKELQCAIDEQLRILKKTYISVSCRFLDLLGDFNETFGYGKSLTEKERAQLVDKTLDKVKLLHEENKEKKILVNSDSTSFLKAAQELEYVYVIPGNITHIDNENSEFTYEKYEKTMLDFFMIANAEKIYLLKEKRMHKSGYPYAASKLYDKRFEIIEY